MLYYYLYGLVTINIFILDYHIDIGDLCDDDIDGDGVPNIKDNCPLVGNPSQEPAMDGKGSKGKACYNDYDGDGVDDNDDVCPENPEIKHTDFRNLETMDLCETSNVKSKIFEGFPI